MRAFTPDQFHAMVAAYGLRHRPSRAEYRYLEMEGHHDSRFWCVPSPTRRIPYFLRTLVLGMDHWNEVIVWPREQEWHLLDTPVGANHYLVTTLLKELKLVNHPPGALVFPREELEPLILLLFAHVAFGAFGSHDLYIIPDHGGQLLRTDHHDVVHVTCRSDQRIAAFVEHMQRHHYELPTELPDWTFKHPHWMK